MPWRVRRFRCSACRRRGGYNTRSVDRGRYQKFERSAKQIELKTGRLAIAREPQPTGRVARDAFHGRLSLPKCYVREVPLRVRERSSRNARFPGPVSPRNCSRGTTVSSISPGFATLSVASHRRFSFIRSYANVDRADDEGHFASRNSRTPFVFLQRACILPR